MPQSNCLKPESHKFLKVKIYNFQNYQLITSSITSYPFFFYYYLFPNGKLLHIRNLHTSERISVNQATDYGASLIMISLKIK